MRRRLVTAGALVLFAVLGAPAIAQTQLCTCETQSSDVCSGDGYRVTLVNYVVDQFNGESHWDYRVCHPGGTESCPPPAHPFSHVSIALPEIGLCLTENQSVVISQYDGFDEAHLTCLPKINELTCGIGGAEPGSYFAQCDIADETSLDPGECVTVRLTIGGEMPTLGPGRLRVRTKADPGSCQINCMLGPTCNPCFPPPPPPEQCLTRTIGFWGTHPHITGLYLPVTACGETLDVVEAGSCNSVTEALCVAPGREIKKFSAYAQLVRQIAAAKLNLNASVALGGGCTEAISARIAECETLCGASQSTISNSGCIEDITAFNESLDSFSSTLPPFDSPGPANPSECQQANGNGLVIGKGACK